MSPLAEVKSALPQPEGQPFGKYHLLERIAAGGMAEIYRARYEAAAGVTKPVVIKKILPHYAGNTNFVSMFVNEAKIAVGLSHGNIAQIFDFGEVNGEYFLAMEYVPGHPLSRVLRKARAQQLLTLPVPLALTLAIEVLKGLHYAHTRVDESGSPLNIVHRDVSAQNVMLSYEGQVKLVDFGIAKARHATAPETQAGAVKGKYVYFAPEQARGKDLDARTDVFAVGTLLYEMLCGRLPFEGKMIEVMSKIVRGEFPTPRTLNPELSPELEKLILGAMALDKADRYPSAQAFQSALEAYLHAHAPAPSASALSSLMNYLFEDELRQSSKPVFISPEFREQLQAWQANAHPSSDARQSATKTPHVKPESTALLPRKRGPDSSEVNGSLNRQFPRWLFVAAPLMAMAVAAVLVFAVGRFATFSVHVTSAPPGAKIQIDEEPAATRATPVLLSDLSANHLHRIHITAPGMKPWAMTVYPVRGEVVRIHAVLEAEQRISGSALVPKGPQTITLQGAEHGLVIPPARAARLKLDKTKQYGLWVEPSIPGAAEPSEVFYVLEDSRNAFHLGVAGSEPLSLHDGQALYLFLLTSSDTTSSTEGLTVKLRESTSGVGTTLLLDRRSNAVDLRATTQSNTAWLDPSRRYTVMLRSPTPVRAVCLWSRGGSPGETAYQLLESGTAIALHGAKGLRCLLAQDPGKPTPAPAALEVVPFMEEATGSRTTVP